MEEAALKAKKIVSDMPKVGDISSVFGLLSAEQLLQWSEKITESAASIYDKAMDSEFIKSGIGGGNHRMFDGGHDLKSAWDAVHNASSDDTFIQEVLAYFQSLWKDVTTIKGLPFVTWDKESFDSFAQWAHNTMGVSKDYVYDLLSFDVMELLTSAIGVVAAVFALNDEDTKRLSEILGSAGVVSVMTANPIMGFLMVIIAGYAYFKKKKEFDKDSLLKGAVTGGISVAIVTFLGLPFLIEFIMVLIVTTLIRKYWDRKVDLLPYLKSLYEQKIYPTITDVFSKMKGFSPI